MQEGLRRPSAYFPELESLRGWAVLLVIAFHHFTLLVHTQGTGPFARMWLKVVAAGNTGVTLFFTLSGFLLARPFLDDQLRGQSTSIRGFYRARALRILPLYYLVVLTAWIVNGVPATPKAFLFLRIGFAVPGWSAPWWTLVLEAQFYLLLPVTMLLLRYRWGRWALGGVLLVWIAAHVRWVHDPMWEGFTNGWKNSMFDRGFAFLLGGFAARFHLSPSFARLARVRFLPDALLLAAGVALLFLFRFYADYGQHEALVRMPMYHSCEAALWVTVILSSLALRSPWKKLFINPLLDQFGRISYSMYLWHVPIMTWSFVRLEATGRRPSDPRSVLWIATTFLVVWAVAILSYRLIERPFLRLKARVAASPKDPQLAIGVG